jgi:prepilin-type N-terminal cleavage/methylation domain-containing protein
MGAFKRTQWCRVKGFTLVEILVSIVVLTILVVLVNQIMKSAGTVVSLGNKRMDADNQGRPFLDRMAEDFSQIVKRADLDYYFKVGNAQAGNDQIAFYSQVSGFYPSQSSQSSFSVIAYRINASSQAERMAKGLIWNGVSSTYTPITFLPITIASNWPGATNATADSDYELIGPQVFRFEYYYQLRSGTLTDTPWDTTLGHTSISGLRDVAAIIAMIGVIEPKSRVIVTQAQLTNLAGRMLDYSPSRAPKGNKTVPAPQADWEDVVKAAPITTGMPVAALLGIRIYQRYFFLNALQQ